MRRSSVTRSLAFTAALASLLAAGAAYAGDEKPVAPEASPVTVHNIGLHIGGGPNDAATKAPFLRQIAAQFEAFRGCYAAAEAPPPHGTFGIDLLVPKEGGHAEASNPRTNLKGDAFQRCVIGAFEAVTFDPPKRGATKLSYALAFDRTPGS
jgi:hypothetical protein